MGTHPVTSLADTAVSIDSPTTTTSSKTTIASQDPLHLRMLFPHMTPSSLSLLTFSGIILLVLFDALVTLLQLTAELYDRPDDLRAWRGVNAAVDAVQSGERRTSVAAFIAFCFWASVSVRILFVCETVMRVATEGTAHLTSLAGLIDTLAITVSLILRVALPALPSMLTAFLLPAVRLPIRIHERYESSRLEYVERLRWESLRHGAELRAVRREKDELLARVARERERVRMLLGEQVVSSRGDVANTGECTIKNNKATVGIIKKTGGNFNGDATGPLAAKSLDRPRVRIVDDRVRPASTDDRGAFLKAERDGDEYRRFREDAEEEKDLPPTPEPPRDYLTLGLPPPSRRPLFSFRLPWTSN